MLAKELQQLTGQPFVVDNKPGGNNLIGVQALHAAPADGYTLFFASNGVMAANVAAFKNPGYDPIKDFTPIGMALKSRWVLAVSAASPYQTIEDLVAAGRADPKLLSAGAGSAGYQMAAALFAKATGTQVNIIPYKGTAHATADVAGGQISFAVADGGAFKSLVASNKLRALVVFGDERSPLFPQVPSLKERGFGSTSLYSWAGLWGPPRLPPAVATRLTTLMAEALRKEDFLRFLAESGAEVGTEGPEQLTVFQKSQIEEYRHAMGVAGLEPQ